MVPEARAVMMVPSRTPWRYPRPMKDMATETTTMELSNAILHLGKGFFAALAMARTMPSPGRVIKLALTCRNTPMASRKQPRMFHPNCSG